MQSDRELGPQPLSALMLKHALTPNDLVSASTEQLTHKMIARATKGRRLTSNTMSKVLNALNQAAASNYARAELFNYAPTS